MENAQEVQHMTSNGKLEIVQSWLLAFLRPRDMTDDTLLLKQSQFVVFYVLCDITTCM